jgi:eukaryotic-like serine/threonine-protein kinase
VERVLGVGGMGMVVAAHHLELETTVALKFMLAKVQEDGEAAARFLREARAAARLRGDHTARVTDFGKLESGSPYIVIEYLEGEDLGDLVRRQGPLSIGLAARCVAQACEAIQEAHSLGIIHRDLKPSNLFLTRRLNGQPCVKVLDFGISKFTISTDRAELQKTSTGAVFGSPMYMSPEQMRAARQVSPRSDIWSLGATLYELLTGTIPFVAETVMELALKVAEESPAPPSTLRSDVPPSLDAIVLRCLQKDPDQRYQSARELGDALAAFAEDAGEVPVLAVTGLHAKHAFVDPTAETRSATPEPNAGLPTLTQATWGSTGRLKKSKRRRLRFALVAAGALLAALAMWLVTRAPQPEAAVHALPRGSELSVVSARAAGSLVSTPTPLVEATAQPVLVAPPSASVRPRPAPAPQQQRAPAVTRRTQTSAVKPPRQDDPFADPR